MVISKKTKKPVVIDSSANANRKWRPIVQAAASEALAGGPMLEGPLAVEFYFFQDRPKAHYRTGRYAHLLKDDAPAHPLGPPDTLKLARSVEDALSGVIYADDAQIVREFLQKEYAREGLPEGVVARVWELA
jgi:Holliday junction resolvase RusA-like endonuclease